MAPTTTLRFRQRLSADRVNRDRVNWDRVNWDRVNWDRASRERTIPPPTALVQMDPRSVGAVGVVAAQTEVVRRGVILRVATPRMAVDRPRHRARSSRARQADGDGP